jgi:phosphoglycerate dehydrogenase-like enzyme
MTPHISGSALSPHFKSRMWTLFGENVDRWRAGKPLLNELPNKSLDPSTREMP